MSRTEQMPTSAKANLLMEKVSKIFNFPPEVIQNIPKATVIGRLSLTVENHRGILEYTPRTIRIQTTLGQMMITGSRLRIGGIYKQDLLIEGEIKQVSFSD
jgi:sporulation protein YqfC